MPPIPAPGGPERGLRRRGRLRLNGHPLACASPLPVTGFLASSVVPGGCVDGRGAFRPITKLCRVPEPGPTKTLACEIPPCPYCRPPRPCADECTGVRGCLHCCLDRGGCEHAEAALAAVPDPERMLMCVVCLDRTHAPLALVNAATGAEEPHTYCSACSDRLATTTTFSPTTRARVDPIAIPRLSRNAVSALLATPALPEGV